MPSLRVLLSSGQIQTRVLEMAAAIDRDYSGGPVYLIGILKGAAGAVSSVGSSQSA